MPAARFLVSGKVQGVWFRASTRDEALRLGLDACHAINLPDGRVDVRVSGDAAALDALQAWLRHGPPLAWVEGVAREDIEAADVAPGFDIG